MKIWFQLKILSFFNIFEGPNFSIYRIYIMHAVTDTLCIEASTLAAEHRKPRSSSFEPRTFPFLVGFLGHFTGTRTATKGQSIKFQNTRRTMVFSGLLPGCLRKTLYYIGQSPGNSGCSWNPKIECHGKYLWPTYVNIRVASSTLMSMWLTTTTCCP